MPAVTYCTHHVTDITLMPQESLRAPRMQMRVEIEVERRAHCAIGVVSRPGREIDGRAGFGLPALFRPETQQDAAEGRRVPPTQVIADDPIGFLRVFAGNVARRQPGKSVAEGR